MRPLPPLILQRCAWGRGIEEDKAHHQMTGTATDGLHWDSLPPQEQGVFLPTHCPPLEGAWDAGAGRDFPGPLVSNSPFPFEGE